MAGSNKAADLLKLLQGSQGQNVSLHVATVQGINPVTIIIEGTSISLDSDIFVVPNNVLPLAIGDKFFVLPIAGDGISQRWGLIVRLNR